MQDGDSAWDCSPEEVMAEVLHPYNPTAGATVQQLVSHMCYMLFLTVRFRDATLCVLKGIVGHVGADEEEAKSCSVLPCCVARMGGMLMVVQQVLPSCAHLTMQSAVYTECAGT